MMLKTISYQDIMSWEPCYDPAEKGFCTPEWSGTVIDVLRNEAVPAEDRLWLVCREELIDARTIRLFAVWCARQALALIDEPDPRSVAAVDTSERFANGEATVVELAAAWDAARAAARAAAWDAQINHLIEILEADVEVK